MLLELFDLIRSPLNIVHAGLEIVRSELNLKRNYTSSAVVISSESADMLEHIYSASQAAIDILNDLLQYEHIDSGSFRLELCWRPVANFLKNKLDWAKELAAKRNVQLTIEDRTLAAFEGGVGLTVYSQSFNGDEEAGLESSAFLSGLHVMKDSFLHVDMYKFEQVIRNLITNAVTICSLLLFG